MSSAKKIQEVHIDTHILIWGLKEEKEIGTFPQRKDDIIRCKGFLKLLSEDGSRRGVVSVIVLGEFLAGVHEEEREKCIEYMTKNFLVVPCAALAARDFARITKGKGKDEVGTGEPYETRVWKADSWIVAIALSRDATICSRDPGLINLAELHKVKVEKMEGVQCTLQGQ